MAASLISWYRSWSSHQMTKADGTRNRKSWAVTGESPADDARSLYCCSVFLWVGRGRPVKSKTAQARHEMEDLHSRKVGETSFWHRSRQQQLHTVALEDYTHLRTELRPGRMGGWLCPYQLRTKSDRISAESDDRHFWLPRNCCGWIEFWSI